MREKYHDNKKSPKKFALYEIHIILVLVQMNSVKRF